MWPLRTIGAELRREYKLFQAYWIPYVAQQVVYVIGFLLMLGLFQIITEGKYDGRARLLSMVGFLTWTVADGCLGRLAYDLRDDAQWGTYEQVWLSTGSPLFILFARGLVILLRFSIMAIASAIFLVPIIGAPLPPLQSGLGVILLLPLTLVAVFGLAYMVAGLHLVYQRVASIQLALSTALFFLTGALAPLDYTSRVYNLASRFLPLTVGIKLMRSVLERDVSPSALLANPEFYWLLSTGAVYGIAGFLVFQWAHRVARRDGLLGHY